MAEKLVGQNCGDKHRGPLQGAGPEALPTKQKSQVEAHLTAGLLWVHNLLVGNTCRLVR